MYLLKLTYLNKLGSKQVSLFVNLQIIVGLLDKETSK